MKFRLTTFSIAILIATASFAQVPNYGKVNTPKQILKRIKK
jgi:hypothetical protein